MRSIKARATSSFDRGGQDSMPCTDDHRHRLPAALISPPMMPVEGDTSLATIQSQPFLASLALALAKRSSVSAAKPMTNRGRFDLRWATVARISGFSTSSRVGGRPCFLILLWLSWRGRQSATAAAGYADVGGQRVLDRGEHLPRAFDAHHGNAWRIGQVDGPAHQDDIGAGCCRPRSRRWRWPCLPEGRLAMNAHRVDRLAGRAGSDQHALPSKRATTGQQGRSRSGNFQRLGHAA